MQISLARTYSIVLFEAPIFAINTIQFKDALEDTDIATEIKG